MRYDDRRHVIYIDHKEFVNIARRGISPTLPHDEDEPILSEIGMRRLTSLVGEAEKKTFSYSFSDEGRDFELSCRVYLKDGTIPYVAGEVTSNPRKPRREELSELRGEVFVTALVLCKTMGLSSVNIKLVLSNHDMNDYVIREESVSLSMAEAFFQKCLVRIRIFAKPEIERVTERLPSMRTLRFPYDSIREGQSEFVRTAYRTLSRGGVLYASAPTGTGKTVSALYPAVRALGDRRVEKVFYFTPKTTTAEAAIDCLSLMEKKGAKIKAIRLSAKDKCCTEGRICRNSGGVCRKSAMRRLDEAVMHLYNSGVTVIDSKDLLYASEKFLVCAYELALTYSEICDVIICDFNYLFDPTVYIRRFFTVGGKFAFLVDEAHNLPERAREMYSEEISASAIRSICESALIGPASKLPELCEKASAAFFDTLYPYVKEELRENKDGELVGATNLSEIPPRMYSIFGKLAESYEDEIRHNLRAEDEERGARLALLKENYYAIKHFYDILSRFDSSYKMFIFYESEEIRAKLYCLDTGPVIREKLSLGHSAVMFSATLSPLGYYRAVLGGDRGDEMLEVNSPFTSEQLSVVIMDKVSTRYSEREDTLSAVCRVIAATVSAKRGNYMIFSPSFAYSEALANAFKAKYPKLKIISQTKNMTPKEKEEFLEEFKKEDNSYLIAFCVMGGIYSEGIDLAGDSLIGAVIVGIGIPALSYEREAMAEYFEEKYEEGKQYAYIYPGMNRVFQAAGRVIRREDDRGVIVLIDDRFDDPIYKKSLPDLWRGVKFIGDAKVLKEELEEFWNDSEN